MVGCVCVGCLPRHKVDEGLERHYPQAVGIHDAHDAGKFCLSLGVVANIITQADEAGFELLGTQRAGVIPVKVVEGGPKFIHLLLADALGISGQDLILHFVDGPGDGGAAPSPHGCAPWCSWCACCQR